MGVSNRYTLFFKGGVSMVNDPTTKTNFNIDAKTGAFILIDMLLEKKLIDKETYERIQQKYNKKSNPQSNNGLKTML
jgi:hypothetical protein